jgi:hypothetical protein
MLVILCVSAVLAVIPGIGTTTPVALMQSYFPMLILLLSARSLFWD